MKKKTTCSKRLQLTLLDRRPPRDAVWQAQPAEIRAEVVRLLVMMMRQHVEQNHDGDADE